MPSETSDIKQFLEIARRADAKCEFPWFSINHISSAHSPYSPYPDCAYFLLTSFPFFCPAARIKKSTKTSEIKFKIRCKRFLYTLKLKDSDKADKLKQSLPPGTHMERFRVPIHS